MIDEIYTTILLFMPQVKVARKDIKIRSDRECLYADIECTYRIDGTVNLYTLVMTMNDSMA